LVRKRLYLMRHGSVRYADSHGRPVDPDSVPLTAEGRLEAQRAKEALRGIAFDRVVCSGLRRTLETAEIVAGDLGLPIERNPAFEEIRPGRLSGLEPAELRRVFLAAMDDPQGPADTFMKGETWGEFEARIKDGFEALLALPWTNALLVAHGGVNRILILAAFGLGLESLGRFEQDPCALNILDALDDGRLQVRLLNQTLHDAGKGALREGTMERLLKSFLVQEPSA
jgi:probable phosphoglycerate mutase